MLDWRCASSGVWVWIACTACKERLYVRQWHEWFFFFFTHAVMWPSLIHSALNWRHCVVGFLLHRLTYYMLLFDMETEAMLIQLNWRRYIIRVIKKKLKWWVTRAIGRLAYLSVTSRCLCWHNRSTVSQNNLSETLSYTLTKCLGAVFFFFFSRIWTSVLPKYIISTIVWWYL